MDKVEYGQLYELNSQIKRKYLKSFVIDDSLIILNRGNELKVKKEGKPVFDISSKRYWRDYFVQLFVDTVIELSEGKTHYMQEVLNNLIKKNKTDTLDDGITIENQIYLNALANKNMYSTTGQTKVSKGTVVYSPFTDNEFLCYLGNNRWMVIFIDFGINSWNILINSIFSIRLKYQIEKNEIVILTLPAEKVLNHGVAITRIDLNDISSLNE